MLKRVNTTTKVETCGWPTLPHFQVTSKQRSECWSMKPRPCQPSGVLDTVVSSGWSHPSICRLLLLLLLSYRSSSLPHCDWAKHVSVRCQPQPQQPRCHQSFNRIFVKIRAVHFQEAWMEKRPAIDPFALIETSITHSFEHCVVLLIFLWSTHLKSNSLDCVSFLPKVLLNTVPISIKIII